MSDNYDYDLVIVGAGSGGLVAAGFAAQLGVRVALVEKERVGGDCTWTGCVPSKALIRAARNAHEIRTAVRYGISAGSPKVDMAGVRDYVRKAIHEVYRQETPEVLQGLGIDVVLAPARFSDDHTLVAGERTLTGKAFLLCTGARPHLPDLPGLSDVPYLTYEKLFDNDRLPQEMVVIGGGPIGLEMAQAYSRLGASVTVVAGRILSKEEPEASRAIEDALAREGLRFVYGRASAFRKEGDGIVVTVGDEQVQGDMLLLATGRTPVVEGLDLERAGVVYSRKGIRVDKQLHTSSRHIYAAGDCVGGYQFTHFAGWQAFQAARNALLLGSSEGFSDAVPWVTFTDPEVAHVGLLEAQAERKHGSDAAVTFKGLDHVDRAICEGDEAGFIKIVHKKDGTLLGATVVAARAGEVITEFVVALQNKLKLGDLAGSIHPYPTYSTPVQMMAADVAVNNLLGGTVGTVIRRLSGLAVPD